MKLTLEAEHEARSNLELAKFSFDQHDYATSLYFSSKSLEKSYDYLTWKYFLLSNCKLGNFHFLLSIIESLDETDDPDIAVIKFDTFLYFEMYSDLEKLVHSYFVKNKFDETARYFCLALINVSKLTTASFAKWTQQLPPPVNSSPFWRIVAPESHSHAASNSTQARRRVFIDLTGTIDHLVSGYSLTGIQRVCYSLLIAMNEIEDKKLDVHVAYTTHFTGYKICLNLDEFCDALLERNGKSIKRLNAIRSWNPLLFGISSNSDWKTLTIVNPSQQDVFFFPDVFWGPHFWNYKSSVECYKCKFVVFIHDIILIKDPLENASPQFSMAFKTAVEHAISSANLIMVQSNSTRNDVLLFAKSLNEKIKLITARFGDDNFKFKVDTKAAALPSSISDKRFLLSVGTLSKRKGFVQLASVFEDVLKDLPLDSVLVFCGKWNKELPEYKEIAETIERNINRIFFIESPNDEQLAKLYRDCFMFALISQDEGWGMPVSEAMMYRKPLLLSHSGSLPEVAGEIATYVDPNNEFELGAAIKEMLMDENIINRTDEAYNRHEQRTWLSSAASILDILAEV